jgi:hypothetical protein
MATALTIISPGIGLLKDNRALRKGLCACTPPGDNHPLPERPSRDPSKGSEQAPPAPGDDFIVLHSETGDVLLRPIRRKNGRGLIKGLRTLRGLKVEERTPWDEPVRDTSLRVFFSIRT